MSKNFNLTIGNHIHRIPRGYGGPARVEVPIHPFTPPNGQYGNCCLIAHQNPDYAPLSNGLSEAEVMAFAGEIVDLWNQRHKVNAHEALAAYAIAEHKHDELFRVSNPDNYHESAETRLAAEKAYWETLERLFPEIAAKCPVPTMAERIEWFGAAEADHYTDHEAREQLYGSEGHATTADSLIHELLQNLRAEAIAVLAGAPGLPVVVVDESVGEGTVIVKTETQAVAITKLGTGD